MMRRAIPLLLVASAALAGPPAIVQDPLGLGSTAVPYAWWGADDDGLSASMGLVPVRMEPPVCGRFASPGYYSQAPDWLFEGAVGDGGAPLSLQRGNDDGTVSGHQVLTGPTTYTGSTAVVGPAVLTVPPDLASTDLRIGRRSLLCVADWDPPIRATLATGSGDTGILWAAATAGSAGNAISVQIVANETAGNTATCTASGTEVTVTRQASAVANALVTAVWSGQACMSLLSAAVTGAGTGIPAATGPTALSGGSDQTNRAVAADWTPAVGTTVTWPAPPGVLHVLGEITDASRLTLAVSQAPSIYPTPLVEADGGITGTPSIGSLPSGWRVRQTSNTLFLEPIP